MNRFQPAGNGELIFTGGWELAAAATVGSPAAAVSLPGINTARWYTATVPGTVLTTLVDQGVYPDPYFGLNNLSIPDTLCRQEWWYRTSFRLPAGRTGDDLRLILNGINYKADIWLNGQRLGELKGAFVRGDFEISRLVNRTGVNTLAIHIFPPPHPGIPHEESPSAGTGPNGGQLCLDGPTFISSEGWDWVPGIRDRNIGLWQDVRLKFTKGIMLSDPQVITDLPLPDTGSARLTIKTVVKNTGRAIKRIVVQAMVENIKVSRALTLQPGEEQPLVFTPDEFPALLMQKPRLWWPNGYGEPALYTLTLTATGEKGEASDSLSLRFGVREFSYELAAVDGGETKRLDFNPLRDGKGRPVFDNLQLREVGKGTVVPTLMPGASLVEKGKAGEAVNPYLVIYVNGQRIYCKGGNWGMDDGMKRVSRQRLEPYIRLHREAHFNMVRNWTGESTEEDFYALCDEYGLLVWNDFWMSTGGYNLYPADDSLFLANAGAAIKRFRNHASIALWCARNEGYPEPVIEKGLAQLVATIDGTRHYQPNSRYLNLRGSGPWHYFRDPADYFRNNAGGFNTELGTPSIPTAASMRKMMTPEDCWPISDAWYYHDLHDGQQPFRRSLDSLYDTARDLDDFCKKAQLLNYESHRAMFESWNSRLWDDASGVLLWMTHPAWPSLVWQVYSWDYETFGSYYASQKACEPVHIQLNGHNNRVVAVNTSLKAYDTVKAVLEVYGLDGQLAMSNTVVLSLPANGKKEVTVFDTAAVQMPVYLVRLRLYGADGGLLSQNEYWKTGAGTRDFKAFNTVGVAEVTATTIPDGKGLRIALKNTGTAPAIQLKLSLVDTKTGQAILPAYFSDGYFALMPGEGKQLSLAYTGDLPACRLSVTAEAYNGIRLRTEK